MQGNDLLYADEEAKFIHTQPTGKSIPFVQTFATLGMRLTKTPKIAIKENSVFSLDLVFNQT